MATPKNVKMSLINATNAVRSKFKELQRKDQKLKQKLTDKYQPITSKLTDLIAVNTSNSKPESKIKDVDDQSEDVHKRHSFQKPKDIVIKRDRRKRLRDVDFSSKLINEEIVNERKKKNKTGTGLTDGNAMEFMNDTKSCSDVHSYWRNPNDLVNRLRILIASSYAGHSGHNNEIISILQELREHNYVE